MEVCPLCSGLGQVTSTTEDIHGTASGGAWGEVGPSALWRSVAEVAPDRSGWGWPSLVRTQLASGDSIGLGKHPKADSPP